MKAEKEGKKKKGRKAKMTLQVEDKEAKKDLLGTEHPSVSVNPASEESKKGRETSFSENQSPSKQNPENVEIGEDEGKIPAGVEEIKEESASSDESMESEESEDEKVDELLFMEAVASLNENISMITMNSSEIFNSFQKMVEQSQDLASAISEMTTQMAELSKV